ncbi:MAG TPA: hypothetical protein VJL80_07380 [Aeromicrobium sp.]|nr:hypothetical protein [Aeromicrobium sp.]HKY57843.1 hypothetical protein [Aeromicrobium sp.]
MNGPTVKYPDGFRVTRLPAGSAAGLTWLVFIVEGRDISVKWYYHERMTFIDASGDEIETFGGGGGNDELWLDHLSLKERTFTIRYHWGGEQLLEEHIAL